MRWIWCYDLRQPSEHFWHSTPREFNGLWKRHKEAIEIATSPIIQMAAFTSLYVNSHLPEDHAKTSPEDFIPKFGSQGKPESPPLSPFEDLMRKAVQEAKLHAKDADEVMRIEQASQKYLS